MVPQRKRVTVLANIPEDRLAAYFSKFGFINDVSQIMSKAGISTRDFVLQVIMDRKLFLDIPDTLACRQCKMFVIVDGRRSHCWTCNAVGTPVLSVSREETSVTNAVGITNGNSENREI